MKKLDPVPPGAASPLKLVLNLISLLIHQIIIYLSTWW